MNAGTRQISMAAAGAVAALALTGCGAGDAIGERAAEAVVERASDGAVDIDSDSGQVTIQDDEGGSASIGIGTDIPAEFTDAVDLPDGFEVMSVTEIEDEGSGGIAVAGMVETGSMGELVAQIDAIESSGGWAPLEGSEEGNLYDGVAEMDTRMLERGDEYLMITVVTDDVDGGPHQITAMWMPNGA